MLRPLTRDTAVRRTVLWLEQWQPTTLSRSTIERIAQQTVSSCIRPEKLILQTPPDGYFLFYSIMAARDPDGWRYKRSALGFLSDRTLERDEQAQARSMKCALIDQMRAVGDEAEAARLELPGAEGYPDIDNMQVLANMLSIRIELHSFSFELPVMTFGDGALVRIGHMQLLSDTDSSSGHFVALRTVDNVEGYCMASADDTSQTLVLGPSSNSFLSGSRSEEKISTNYSDEELPPIDANDNAQDTTFESSTSTTSSSYSCSTNTSSSSTFFFICR